jgi:hypothetical protein
VDLFLHNTYASPGVDILRNMSSWENIPVYEFSLTTYILLLTLSIHKGGRMIQEQFEMGFVRNIHICVKRRVTYIQIGTL